MSSLAKAVRWCLQLGLWLAVPVALGSMGVPQIQYLSHDEFLDQAYAGKTPAWKMLRLTPALRNNVEQVLGHPYQGARLRYWVDGNRTAWIVDEVGKELPITIGVVVDSNRIEQIKILVYREERGGEVHQDFFTRQFQQVTLAASGQLSAPIDGITGATLSVNAVTRVAQLVLMLHQQVMSRPAH